MSTKILANEKTTLEALWAIVCNSASVDQQSNQLSIFNIIENFTISKSPNPVTPLSKEATFSEKTQIKFDHTLVVQFERNTFENKPDFNPFMEIKIVDPSGDVLIANELPIKFEDGKSRVRVIITLDSFIATKSGRYAYVISARASHADKLGEATRVSMDVKIYE